jgi:hypothetical protein
VASSPYTVTHGLNTTTPVVEVWDAVTGQVVVTQIVIASPNSLQISVATNMPNNANVVVVGSAASPVPISPADYANKAYVDARTPNLPAPITSGSGTQSFTDALGDVWVARNGVNSGAWKRARDVLHCRYYRSAAYNLPVADTLFPFDTSLGDPYSLYTIATSLVTFPIAGLFRVELQVGASATASGQWVQCLMRNAGATAVAVQTIYSSTATTAMGPICSDSSVRNAGDSVTVRGFSSVALVTVVGMAWTHLYVDYLGTG